jgi:hypothetical protein
VRGRQNGKRRRHAGLAWLAIVSLLLEALLPTAFAAAAAGLEADGSRSYCGASGGDSGPSKQSRAAPRHCVFCLAAVPGLAPGYLPSVLAPGFAGIAVAGPVGGEMIRGSLARRWAQPRGPPVTG